MIHAGRSTPTRQVLPLARRRRDADGNYRKLGNRPATDLASSPKPPLESSSPRYSKQPFVEQVTAKRSRSCGRGRTSPCISQAVLRMTIWSEHRAGTARWTPRLPTTSRRVTASGAVEEEHRAPGAAARARWHGNACPSASTHCMRHIGDQRRMSPSRLCGRWRQSAGPSAGTRATRWCDRLQALFTGMMPSSPPRRTSSGAEARGSRCFSVRRKTTSFGLSACEVVIRVRCCGSRAARLPLAQAARQRLQRTHADRTGRPSRSTRSAAATWRTAAPAGHPRNTRASTLATTE